MPTYGKLPGCLLWALHLLSIGVLPGTYVLLLFREHGANASLYVFWTWEWLACLLPFAVAGLLVWRLAQRRWGQAAALALLIGVDMLARYGYYFAFFVSSMTAKPT